MNLSARIECLSFVGEVLRAYLQQISVDTFTSYYLWLSKAIEQAEAHNPWFTKDNVYFALNYWAQNLTESNLKQWLSAYNIEQSTLRKQNVLIVAAGNIPLVSFHDVISVYLVGHKAIVKLSSKDKHLLTCIVNILNHQYPETADYFLLTEERVPSFDAVIATGSNQSLPYFESYFGKKPHIFRGHRNAVAILTGNECPLELQLLGDDVFRYFGLGCRNVSKIFVPEGYSFDLLIKAFKKWEHVFYHHYYLSNYEYQKTIYLLNKEEFIDGGFFMLKHSDEISSPIGVIFYEYFSELRILATKISAWLSQIQCVVSKQNNDIKSIAFGTSQVPRLCDYADNVDVINFLIQL